METNMDKILFLAHTQEDGSLAKGAYEALNAALTLTADLGGVELTVGLIGKDVQAAADSIASCGAAGFLAVSGADFADSRYSSDAAAVVALVKQAAPTLVIASTSSRFSRCLPGAAFRCDGRIETHITDIKVADGVVQVQRWYYRQRMVATLSRAQRPWFLVVDSGVFQPWQGAAGSAAVQAVNVALGDECKRTRVLGVQSPGSDTQTIRPDARLLFVAGAGWAKKQQDGQLHIKRAEGLILEFISKSKASLGSSKSLVDQSSEGEVISFMSHLNQVGQTGSTPRHPKGLATCCHGEEPHTVGWRFINERRAISLDANCGWAQGKADVLYVADAFEVIARANELLEKG
jgi:electron transfer flavoprotein alpha subunit